MELGVIISLSESLEQEFERLVDLGFPTCQLNCWDESQFTPENTSRVKRLYEKTGIRITAMWCGWGGPAVWDFYEGPLTLGIVPVTYRHARTKTLMKGAEFTAAIGVRYMVTHVGFIPEDPNHPDYAGVVSSLRYLVRHCAEQEVDFLFETGQETPVTLLRAIEDIAMDNVGVNLDPANLVLYGKGNPLDALDVVGKYVRGVHAKDGLYPTTGSKLGEEVPLGEGKVNISGFVKGLKQIGYAGAITIEREISGPRQIEDIKSAKELLECLL